MPLAWITSLLTAVSLLGAVAWAARPAAAQAYGERSAVVESDCDHDCLIGFARRYMDGLVHHDPARVPFAKTVKFTENDVVLAIGRGLWGSISGAASNAMLAADPQAGNVAWFGTVDEHGAPAYYAMRLKVRWGRITEVETVVDRKTELPAPFGDPGKLVHDPAFAQVLPPSERRERERLRDVANGYFSTVERNDGDLLTLFDPDCQRIENGISTTRGSFGSAALAQGCEAQFKLRYFRINKRVRERRFPLIDVQRGVVVATGFFDHDNSFDRYRTTDGKEHRTLLKWPNSLSLMEAFNIRNGRIYRVEAVFTYVPYFMHSPWEDPMDIGGTAAGSDTQAGGTVTEADAAGSAGASGCDARCLSSIAARYMSALVAHDGSRVPWARVVRYSENSVPMMIGDGEWNTVSAISGQPLIVSDPSTGNVAWLGLVEEHGDPAYYGMRLEVRDQRITEAEAVIEPKNDLAPFGEPAAEMHDPGFAGIVPAAERSSRARLTALAERYYEGLQSGAGSDWLRTRCFPIVDVEHGMVVALVFVDHPADGRSAGGGGSLPLRAKYPLTLGLLQALEIRHGQVVHVQTIATNLPYSMPSPWAHVP